jgi:purine nucleosidase
MKVILDTDIGSDIDDAICLAYLLAQPECELLGVTTVSGEPVERAKLVSALCKAAGKDIPIYPGSEQPILSVQRQPRSQQSAMLDRWPHETEFPRYEAVEFLRQTIRANPGEVTLLAIGPMTNLGLLFATDPEIPALLKQLVMMIGVFTHQVRGVGPVEWNAICDPHASAVVYKAAPTIHRSVGLDVTNRVTMKADEVRQRFQTPLLRPVLDFAEVWFKERDTITFHDPLAATMLFDDQICMFRRGQVSVELMDEATMGMTLWKEGEGPHEVALDVKPERFFEHYFGTVNAASR